MKLTKTVKCLELGNAVKEPAAGSSCLVAGWGTTKNVAKQMSDVLMSVNVTVIDRVKCNSPEYYGLNPVITSSMICAGSDGQNTADTCQVSKQPVTTTLTATYVPKNDMSCIYYLSRGILEGHCCAMER